MRTEKSVDLNRPCVLCCPCGQWHMIYLRATEPFKHRFRCGLNVTIDNGVIEFTARGQFKPRVVGMASNDRHLFVLVVDDSEPLGKARTAGTAGDKKPPANTQREPS